MCPTVYFFHQDVSPIVNVVMILGLHAMLLSQYLYCYFGGV